MAKLKDLTLKKGGDKAAQKGEMKEGRRDVPKILKEQTNKLVRNKVIYTDIIKDNEKKSLKNKLK